MRLSRVTFGVLAGLLAACATPFEKIDMASLPTAEDHPEHNAVILLDERTLTFDEEDGKPITVDAVRRRWRDFHASGTIHPSAEYNKDTTKVRKLAFRGVNVYEPDDEIIVQKSAKNLDKPVAPESGIYSNTRKLILNDPRISSLPPGSIREYYWEMARGKADLVQYFNNFQNNAPTKAMKLTVRIPKGWTAEWKTFGGGKETKWAPTESEEDGFTVWIWERTDVPALDDAPDAREWANVPRVAVRLKTWTIRGEDGAAPNSFSELSKREWESYSKTREGTDEELARLAQDILKDAPKRPMDRAARLYSWVRDNVSYCQYYGSFDEGFVPHDVKQTELLRYGDCKDQSNILFGLLQADGINAQLGTLWRHKGVPRTLAFPSMAGNSNHVAVMVKLPEGDFFADPVNSATAFGELESDEFGAWFMPLTAKGAEPVRLGTPGAKETTDTATVRIKVKEDLSQEIQFERILTGAFAVNARRDLLKVIPENWKTAATLPIPAGVDEASVENGEVPALPKPLIFKGTAKAPKADPVGNLQLLSPHAWGWRVPGAGSARIAATVNPFATSFPYTKKYEVRIEYPTAGHISSVPGSQTAKSRFGSMSVSYEQRGKELVIRYEETNTATLVPAENLPEFRQWVKEADDAAVSAVVIRKKGGA